MTPPQHVVFYGSLQEGLRLGGEPPFEGLVERVGTCRLPGRLYEVGDGAYPGLEVLASDVGEVVHGELHRILDPAVLVLLDEWEEYDPHRPEDSPYVRRVVRLLEPELDAWVYEGRHLRRGPVVAGGDWRLHRERRPRDRGH
jgi:gamma-glutamylcyclotransferase (GGCT)/AIG2-like uncharacterized protein YtfP